MKKANYYFEKKQANDKLSLSKAVKLAAGKGFKPLKDALTSLLAYKASTIDLSVTPPKFFNKSKNINKNTGCLENGHRCLNVSRHLRPMSYFRFEEILALS